MKKEESKNRTSRLRRIELIVWIVILIVLSAIGTLLWLRHDNTYEMHNIYMPDVDGLIVGSPVYTMGIQVGYVTKAKITNDEKVRVKFKITNRNVKVLPGTVATVEFSGLGGSKSLQLYPPDGGVKVTEALLTSNTDYILVERPKRLRDASALLFEMYKTLMNIIYSVTYFGNEVSKTDNINIPAGNINETNEFINYSNKYINTTNSNLNRIRDSVNKFTDGKYDWRTRNER